MCQRLLSDASFFGALQHCDKDMAATCREAGCPYCEGVLHSAKYPRKPRGACTALGDEYDYRFSFCCAVDDCRRRTTPPSVRFLGRRVYLGAVVVLASVLLHGASAKRVTRLKEMIGVDRRTLERWRVWWLAELPRSTWWQRARGELATTVDEARQQARRAGIDGILAIGGNGTLTGAAALCDPQELGDQDLKVVGLPASIDNDIGLSGMAIGADTAMNTIMEAWNPSAVDPSARLTPR